MLVREGYKGSDISLELYPACHEIWGIFGDGKKPLPGATRHDIQELCEDIIIKDEIVEKYFTDENGNDSAGWYHKK